MTDQIHKRLEGDHVRMILGRHIKKEISGSQAMDLLGLKRRQFFEWVKRYRQAPDSFTVDYKRTIKVKKIGKDVENSIIMELATEKRLIDDPAMPVRYYNYSYIRDQLRKTYSHEVSLPTIIARAKKTVFTFLSVKRRFMTMRCQRIM
jgi:hypothetical protein